MPGRGSYGPGGKWIHDRAEHILQKGDLQEGHGSRSKGIAYALATQQAHKLGKTPKKGAGPSGMYGTKQGKKVALKKLDKPRGEYVKTPAPKEKTAWSALPLFLGLRKMAAPQMDPETGLVVKPPTPSLTGKPKAYAQANIVPPPAAKGLDFNAKSLAPPPVKT